MARRCKNKECKKPYEPTFNSLQETCSIPCAIIWSRTKAGIKNAEKIKRNANKERRAEFKTAADWTQDVQKRSFNPYIRERDKPEPCISCGLYDHEIPTPHRGGKWDAGHYRTVGAAPELRFEVLNCNKQCKGCNNPGPNRAERVARQYRINLIKKIGLAKVEWLEGPHKAKHYDKETLIELHKKYRSMTKQLKKSE